jgi:hypothetical protein
LNRILTAVSDFVVVGWFMATSTLLRMGLRADQPPLAPFGLSASALDSLDAAPQPRTGADGLTECARQMALIRKPAGAGNLRESFVGGQ